MSLDRPQARDLISWRREVEARMNLNAKQRREKSPYDSYDVPINSLIVRGASDSDKYLWPNLQGAR